MAEETEEQNTPDPTEGMEIDINKVMNALHRQIAEQSQKIALKDAIIETQAELLTEMRLQIDDLAKAITSSNQKPQKVPVRPAIPKKGRK
jgi:hypothetical protein